MDEGVIGKQVAGVHRNFVYVTLIVHVTFNIAYNLGILMGGWIERRKAREAKTKNKFTLILSLSMCKG